MQHNKPLTPEEILSYNNAFTQSLKAMGEVLQAERLAIIDEAMYISRTIERFLPIKEEELSSYASGDGANPLAGLSPGSTNITPDAEADLAPTDGQAEPKDDDLLYDNIIQALKLAQLNTVSAQQQLFTTSIAAITMGISEIYAEVDSPRTQDLSESPADPVNHQ